MTARSTSKADAAAQTVSGAGLVVSCIPMVAMLPGAVGGALGLVGLGASSAVVSRLTPALNGVAQPLLFLSIALLVVGGLRCGRVVMVLALIGGALLYVSMYVWTTDGGSTSPGLFYVGLLGFIAAYGISWLRRRGRKCRPLVSPMVVNRLLVAVVVIGIFAVAYAAVTGAPGPAMPMTVHI